MGITADEAVNIIKYMDGAANPSTKREITKQTGTKSQVMSARRLAAIPLPGTDNSVQESSPLTAPALGLTALGAAVCVGYALRRRCAKATAKRRDSFGFLPDSERPSLNACELNV